MSNRTLIEINHDNCHDIVRGQEAFMQAIIEMMRGGGSPRVVEQLERFGVTHVGQRHHSDRCSVSYPHHKVEL